MEADDTLTPLLPLNATNVESLTFIDLHPLEIARQLTLIDHEMYRVIGAPELYRCAWNKKGSWSNTSLMFSGGAPLFSSVSLLCLVCVALSRCLYVVSPCSSRLGSPFSLLSSVLVLLLFFCDISFLLYCLPLSNSLPLTNTADLLSLRVK
jgi:RasGEF domain